MTLELLFWMIAGCYVFTASGFVFTFWVYRLMTNHFSSRMKRLEREVFGEEQE